MKNAFALGVFVLAIAMPAMADQANTCIDPERIRGTTVIDEHTILFRMADGKIWVNTLAQACPGLKSEDGFVYAIRGDVICGNVQTIRVLHYGNVCTLGAFTAYGTERPAP